MQALLIANATRSTRTIRQLRCLRSQLMPLQARPPSRLSSGHGGNDVLSDVIQEASVTGPRMALFSTNAEWRDVRTAAGLETTAHDDMHAGELETSIMLHALPEQVGADYAEADHDGGARAHMLSLGLRSYPTTGIVGRPSLATAEKGKAVLDHLTSLAAAHLDILNG